MAKLPRIACEVAADRVVAARATERQPVIEAYSVRSMPAGAVAPSLTGQNVRDRDAARTAIANALATVGAGGRDMTIVLPDAAVRVNLLEFERLPDRREEAAALIRFRLRKSLPFDVERAVVSFDVARVNGASRVVAAVAPAGIVEEYESLFADEGYNAGVVMPAALAMLGNIEGEQPTMVVKVDATSVSVAVVDQRQLRLMRVLDNPAGAAIRADQLAADVFPSAVFFEDTYNASIASVLVAGIIPAAQVAPALESHIEARVSELVGGRHVEMDESGERGMFAGVVGALVG